MTQTEFITKMQSIYGDVYDKLHDAERKYTKLARFFPVEGKKYREGKNRLMLVGRCTRRWWLFDFKDWAKKDYVAKAGESLSNGLGFGFWINDEGKSKWAEIRDRTTKKFIRFTKNPDNEPRVDNEKMYRAKISVPFFSYMQPILKRLIEITDPWYEHMVWSNLYPVQEEDKITDKDMRELLHKPCVELLKTQIEYFEPTHIIFNTGWKASGITWFADFAELFTDTSGENNICPVPNFNIKAENGMKPLVVAKGKYKNASVVVTSRSDAVKNRPTMEDYADQVCAAFHEIEKAK